MGLPKNICHCGNAKGEFDIECTDCKIISQQWIEILFVHHNKKIKYRRDAYCWNCKLPISTDSHVKCSKCGWILCNCGSCDCNRNKYNKL